MKATTKQKQRLKKRKDRFVVGYLSAKNILWGLERAIEAGRVGWEEVLSPLTLRQAEKRLMEMPCAGCAIFELVPVEVNR